MVVTIKTQLILGILWHKTNLCRIEEDVLPGDGGAEHGEGEPHAPHSADHPDLVPRLIRRPPTYFQNII